MLSWCRLCRVWVDQGHFYLPDAPYGRNWDGCGQGRSDLRYHPENPLCGDIWLLGDRHMVVDYVDPFATGVTWSDGTRGGMKYTSGFAHYLEQQRATLVSTWEEWPFPSCDHRGWTRPGVDTAKSCTTEKSLAFLRRVLEGKSLV